MCKRLLLFLMACGAFLGPEAAGSTVTTGFAQFGPPYITERAISLAGAKNGVGAIQDGRIIWGSSLYSDFLCGVWDDLEKSLEELRDQFNKLSDDLQRIPESEEYKKLKKELKRLADEVKRLEKGAREKVQKDIVPRLKKEMEKLRERLRKLLKEEESKPIEV